MSRVKRMAQTMIMAENPVPRTAEARGIMTHFSITIRAGEAV